MDENLEKYETNGFDENKKAETTWSVKIDKALKAELQEFTDNEEGTKGDFLRKAYQLYKTNKIIEGEDVLASEAKEIQAIAERLSRLLINANEKVNTRIKSIHTEAEDKSIYKDKFINKLEEELEGVRASLKDKEELLKEETRIKNENIARVIELETVANKALEDAEISKGQVATLATTIKGLEADREENKSLKQELATIHSSHKKEIEALQVQLAQKEQCLADKDNEIKELKRDNEHTVKDLVKENEREIESFKKDHIRELESAKEKAEARLEKEKMILENSLNKAHMEEMNKLHQLLAEADVLKKQAVLEVQETYNKKIQELQEVIYRLKTVSVVSAKEDMQNKEYR